MASLGSGGTCGEIFAGGDHGLYRITGNEAKNYQTPPTVSYLRYPLFCEAPGDSVHSRIRRCTSWQKVGHTWKWGKATGLKGQEFRAVLEDPDGTVWSSTELAIWHFDFSKEQTVSQNFTTADGVPASKKLVLAAAWSTPLTERADALAEKARRIVRDDELGPEYINRGVSILREDNGGNVWITGLGYQELLEKTPDGFHLFALPFLHTGADELYTLLLDSDGTAWASDSSGALFRMSKLNFKEQRRAVTSLLRRVAVIGEQDSLFEGDSVAPQLSLQHKDNELRFDFAGPYYDGAAAARISVLTRRQRKDMV